MEITDTVVEFINSRYSTSMISGDLRFDLIEKNIGINLNRYLSMLSNAFYGVFLPLLISEIHGSF